MLRISDEQWNAFSQARLLGFESRARQHLERFFPRIIQPTSGSEFRQFLRQCARQADRLGLSSERSILCVAHIALLLGPIPEQHPDFAVCEAILADRDAPPDYRAKVAMTVAYELTSKQRNDAS